MRISSEVPPKKRENCWLMPSFDANAGRIATIARKMEPGSVILVMMVSR